MRFRRKRLEVGDDSPEAQTAAVEEAAAELGGSLSRVFVDPGFDGRRTAILSRPAGREMLATVASGDTVVVATLDRLGHSGADGQPEAVGRLPDQAALADSRATVKKHRAICREERRHAHRGNGGARR